MNNDPKPTKHFRLVCWHLLYHVDVQKSLDRQDEIEACRHAQLDLDRWDEQNALFPREWTKLMAKRQRRLGWLKEHGSVEDGWTPSDPKDPRRSANKPIAAYLTRRGFTKNEFNARFALVPMRRKKGGHSPPWRAIYRVAAWLNT